MARSRRLGLLVVAAAAALAALSLSSASAATVTTTSGLAYSRGILNAAAPGTTGCGKDGNANADGEPAIEVARDDTLALGSERGLGGGSDAWRQDQAVGGSGASACAVAYAGQPNGAGGLGPSGGDIDVATGSSPASTGRYPVYVASLNGGSVSMAHSTDGGKTFTNVPVQAGLPVDDREWIAAFRDTTSILTFHDVGTNNIDVLRSDNGGLAYHQISQAIPATDYRSQDNELGNVAIDRRNLPMMAGPLGSPGFWVYQSFVAPASAPLPSRPSPPYNEAFLSTSYDGGYTWTIKGVPCSTGHGSLDHMFPNVSVAPNGTLWLAWSNDVNVFTATSSDHGDSWTCSKASTNTGQAVMPWLEAGSAGVDLVYYASPTAKAQGTTQTWYVYFAQAQPAGGWATPVRTVAVHSGSVCEEGAACTTGRQLFDDFGVALDQSGWAHVAYSHDAPRLGGPDSYTGYWVQTAGTTVGYPN
jgi:hypothetical protein